MGKRLNHGKDVLASCTHQVLCDNLFVWDVVGCIPTHNWSHPSIIKTTTFWTKPDIYMYMHGSFVLQKQLVLSSFAYYHSILLRLHVGLSYLFIIIHATVMKVSVCIKNPTAFSHHSMLKPPALTAILILHHMTLPPPTCIVWLQQLDTQ